MDILAFKIGSAVFLCSLLFLYAIIVGIAARTASKWFLVALIPWGGMCFIAYAVLSMLYNIH